MMYSKPVLTQTTTVVSYLARYTKRIGLTNARLLKMDDQHIWLRYKNYRQGERQQVMKLKGEELLRRFLLHLLPKGFMRVRYYGFLANAHRRLKLSLIHHALQTQTAERPVKKSKRYEPVCDKCQGIMRIVAEIPAVFSQVIWHNTS